MIIPLILAGGAGRRLSGLTDGGKTKPFLEMFGMSSLFEQTLRRAEGLGYGKPWVSINETQVGELSDDVKNRLGLIISESSRRDTMAAVTLACFEANADNNILVVIPADQIYSSDEDFVTTVNQLIMRVMDGGFGLMGSKPRHPSTAVGYVTAKDGLIKSFTEKPTRTTATRLCEDSNVFWNCGVLVCNVQSFLKYASIYDEESTRHAVFKAWNHANWVDKLLSPDKKFYSAAKSKSFDYALISNLHEVPDILSFSELKTNWYDLGTVEGLLEYVESTDGEKHRDQKSWGWHAVVTLQSNRKIKILCVEAGKSTSLQKHEFRSERWTIIKGSCDALINKRNISFYKDDSVFISEGAWHQINNTTDQPVFILEIQEGAIVDENDIIRMTK